jgi:hypothetical protein
MQRSRSLGMYGTCSTKLVHCRVFGQSRYPGYPEQGTRQGGIFFLGIWRSGVVYIRFRSLQDLTHEADDS